MASIIDDIISAGSFELIRDRIGQILADELPNQASLSGNPNLNATVWIERFIQFNTNDCPCVNISLNRGNYDGFTTLRQDGSYEFYIDVYENSKAIGNENGDKDATFKLHKLANVVRAILSHHKYDTLAFASPFIEGVRVKQISIGESRKQHDADNLIIARMVFEVKAPESTLAITPVDIAGYTTKAVLGETDKGYLFGGDAFEPPVVPSCLPVTITRNGVFLQENDSGTTFNFDTDCEPGTITINGLDFEIVASGETRNILVEYLDGASVPVTLEDEKIKVPNIIICPSSRIYKNPSYTGAITSYADGDAYYRKVNGIGNLIQPTHGRDVRLQFGSQHLLEANNVFGNLFRWSGTTGGYYNPLTDLYYNISNVETTRELAFPDGLGLDHLINRVLQIDQSGTKTWYDWCAYGLTLEQGGFTGFYLPLMSEMLEWGNVGVPIGYRDNDPFDWLNGLKLLAETYIGAGSSQAFSAESYGQFRSTTKANNNKAILTKPIDIEALFG